MFRESFLLLLLVFLIRYYRDQKLQLARTERDDPWIKLENIWTDSEIESIKIGFTIFKNSQKGEEIEHVFSLCKFCTSSSLLPNV